jgi:hypothetical protein
MNRIIMKHLIELDDKTRAGRELLLDVRKRLADDGVKLIKPKKLVPRDMVKGIGRKLTDQELRTHLTRPMKKPVDFDKAIDRISAALSKGK